MGGTGVAVGGTGVAVGGTGVGVAVLALVGAADWLEATCFSEPLLCTAVAVL